MTAMIESTTYYGAPTTQIQRLTSERMYIIHYGWRSENNKRMYIIHYGWRSENNKRMYTIHYGWRSENNKRMNSVHYECRGENDDFHSTGTLQE